jgi:transcriptional regulator with XRE-family HTH domain/KaiC/GvpD/RAD55 family RecA-like ATPase
MKQIHLSTGIQKLDYILDGLHIGDNVVWQDDTGSLAWVFCWNFLNASRQEGRPIIYASFDRSPKTILNKLGDLIEYENLTILDCFTDGKGASSPVFNRFYDEGNSEPACTVVRVENPGDISAFNNELYSLNDKLPGNTSLVFDSLSGMQEIWGGEDALISFYTHACPRLFELETIAYWTIDKKAHSQRLKARITSVAQVVVELTIKRGTTSLTIIKADGRESVSLQKPFNYWIKSDTVQFDQNGRLPTGIELGSRIRGLRNKKGLSQTELARMVGVTPSTISQVEGNVIYPSLPALLKMAEVLQVEISSFFQETAEKPRPLVFDPQNATAVKMPPALSAVTVQRLSPADFDGRVDPYIIDIPGGASIAGHFFFHKGEEIGYLINGRLELIFENTTQNISTGSVIYLTSQTPSGWCNPDSEPARLLWYKLD